MLAVVLKLGARAYQLRAIREEQRVTQKELAERTALTQPTISALESGDLDRSGGRTSDQGKQLANQTLTNGIDISEAESAYVLNCGAKGLNP